MSRSEDEASGRDGVRRGRRPGPSTTRAEILEAARALFGTRGYDGTTLRMIAERARVDPALVARAFEGKQGLFQAAVQWPWNPVDVVPQIAAGPRSRAGHRLARVVVDTWEDPEGRSTLLALLTSASDSEVARTLLRDFVTTQVLVPFVQACGFDHPELRGAVLAAHHVGLVTVRYVLRIEPLASLDADALVELMAPTSQRLLTQPVPDLQPLEPPRRNR
jgi:AcrR family transcriptional regulator